MFSRSWRHELWRQRVVLLLGVGIQTCVVFVASRTYLARHNTLQANGNWRSTKTEIGRGVNGAFAFVTELQTLAGGKLDLGAWHGHNEVIHRQQLVEPQRIEFDFELADDSCLVALLDRDADGDEVGVRLSAFDPYPNAFLVIARDGEFLDQEYFPVRRLSENRTHRADIRVGPERLSVRVDGTHLGTFRHRFRERQFFGFRGGLRPVHVDNIAVTLASGARLTESFDGPAPAGWVTAATVLVIPLLNLACLLLVRRLTGAEDIRLGFHFLMVNLTLLVIGGLLYAFVLARSSWYPRLDGLLQASEAYYRNAAMDWVLNEIQERYRAEPRGDHIRILFVGSSQTWGAGAMRDDQTFVAVLEKLLDRDRPGGRPVECINAGISATRAVDLAPLLATDWLALEPQVVVINLSNNDRRSGGSTAFAPALDCMVTAVLRAGACPVLVKEANCVGSERQGVEARHREIDHLAARAGVPVIDMHETLHQFEDKGFLWWDHVHLTVFGQRIVAEQLHDALPGVLAEVVREPGLPGAR